MMPGQPARMSMKAKTVFAKGTQEGEDALNKAIEALEKDGYSITQIMNITSNETLDDQWKLIVFGAKEVKDIIEKPKTALVFTGEGNRGDH